MARAVEELHAAARYVGVVMNGTVPKSANRPQPKGGSRKGIPNKATKELKDMILGALNKAGGETYLEERARDPRTAAAFLGLVGRVLPKDLNVKASLSLADIVREAREQAKKA